MVCLDRRLTRSIVTTSFVRLPTSIAVGPTNAARTCGLSGTYGKPAVMPCPKAERLDLHLLNRSRLAFACGASVTLFAFWKYYVQKHYLKSNNKRLQDLKSMSAYNRSVLVNRSFAGGGGSGHQNTIGNSSAYRNESSSILSSLSYKPLNDVVYLENQLDENTVEV